MKQYAEFYKCALQVNPYGYISYRGATHEDDEETYNQNILKYCKEKEIVVIGLADHGNSDTSENLRRLLEANELTVFPGFEISTAEKIHIVCLFSEKTTTQELNRYLGRLGLTSVDDPVMSTQYSCLEVAKIIEELNGFWYAAHVTSDNGILKIGKMNRIWSDDKLKAAQIPHDLDNVDPKYLNILRNKDPEYKRPNPLALINAKDICRPEDLLERNAYCLVKMTELSFENFKEAFCDPSARVKLSSDQNERYQSSIDKIEIFGGYLDGLSIDLSKNLNCFIGGRGTGKSTLLEILRYTLDCEPKGSDSKRYFQDLIKANLGTDNGRVELIISSNKEHGRKYKVIKRYHEKAVIKNEKDEISHLTVKDLFPSIEIFGQNEIMELVSSEEAKISILNRFLPNQADTNSKKQSLLRSLKKNSDLLYEKNQKKETFDEDLSKLPKLVEKKCFFDQKGISDKLSIIDCLAKEEEHLRKSLEKLESNNLSFPKFEPSFTSDFISSTNNGDKFERIAAIFENINKEFIELEKSYFRILEENIVKVKDIQSEWLIYKKGSEDTISTLAKSIPDLNGKSGNEIAIEYQNIVSEIARITPVREDSEKISADISSAIEHRRSLLEALMQVQDEAFDSLRRVIKKLNKSNLSGKIQIEVFRGKNREELIKFLSEIDGIGPKSVSCLREVETLTISSFISHIEEGPEKLVEEYGFTRAKADIITNLPLRTKLDLELVQLSDTIEISLNVSGDGKKATYKPLRKLSKGQQCTAILNILMLENNDPLIIDQPEDNLDNSFIANNFIDGLRDYKLNRQFIFATHNANIPVFGDSELIAVMREFEGQGCIEDNCIGSVDNKFVKTAVINTLEGGSTAFQMRKAKYNL